MLLFMDGFDHYVTANILSKWTSGGGNIINPGRTGIGCLQVPITLTKTLPSSYSTIITGFALYVAGFTNDAYVVKFNDGATTHLGIITTTDGRFAVRRGDGTWLGVTATSPVTLFTWNYVEFKATIDDSVGSYEIRVNGVTILSATGIDTRNGGASTANTYSLDADSNYYYDDLYVCDDSGSINNTFRGDVKIECLFPTSDGYLTQFTPSTPGDHYTLVDEAAPDGDTTYVYTSGIGNIDSYGFSNLTVISGSVLGVQVLPYARKDDAGSRSFAPMIYISGVAYSGEAISIGNTYVYYPEIFDLSPATSSAWTIAEVNASEFGTKLVS
jgi:hypothetical protein